MQIAITAEIFRTSILFLFNFARNILGFQVFVLRILMIFFLLVVYIFDHCILYNVFDFIFFNSKILFAIRLLKGRISHSPCLSHSSISYSCFVIITLSIVLLFRFFNCSFDGSVSFILFN